MGLSSGPLPASACYLPPSALPSGTLTAFSPLPEGPPACGVHVCACGREAAGERKRGANVFPSAALATQPSPGCGCAGRRWLSVFVFLNLGENMQKTRFTMVTVFYFPSAVHPASRPLLSAPSQQGSPIPVPSPGTCHSTSCLCLRTGPPRGPPTEGSHAVSSLRDPFLSLSVTSTRLTRVVAGVSISFLCFYLFIF